MEINFRHEINGVKVITAIAQDADTNQILMLANMNKEALINPKNRKSSLLEHIQKPIMVKRGKFRTHTGS